MRGKWCKLKPGLRQKGGSERKMAQYPVWITPKRREGGESGVNTSQDYARKQEMRGKWRKLKPGLRQKGGSERKVA